VGEPPEEPSLPLKPEPAKLNYPGLLGNLYPLGKGKKNNNRALPEIAQLIFQRAEKIFAFLSFLFLLSFLSFLSFLSSLSSLFFFDIQEGVIPTPSCYHSGRATTLPVLDREGKAFPSQILNTDNPTTSFYINPTFQKNQVPSFLSTSFLN